MKSNYLYTKTAGFLTLFTSSVFPFFPFTPVFLRFFLFSSTFFASPPHLHPIIFAFEFLDDALLSILCVVVRPSRVSFLPNLLFCFHARAPINLWKSPLLLSPNCATCLAAVNLCHNTQPFQSLLFFLPCPGHRQPRVPSTSSSLPPQL